MLEIKRGDTFAFYANMTDGVGNPFTTDVVNMKSQIRDTEYQFVTELTIAATDVDGRYLFTAPSTDDWPTEIWGDVKLIMDIEININGVVQSSDTVDIMVVKDVTYDE